MAPINDRFFAWASAQIKEANGLKADDPAVYAAFRPYAVISADQQNAKARIAALGWLSIKDRLSPTSGPAMIDEALRLAAVTPVPRDVLNRLKISKIMITGVNKRNWQTEDTYALITLAKEPGVADDALTADTLLLVAARNFSARNPKNASPLFAQVANDDRLPAQHPVKQTALLELAGFAAASGDRALAQQYFNKTGLTEEQCGLLQVRPVLKRTNVGDSGYPADSAQMGFEGWVQAEFDIQTNGKPVNVRPIVAYPPLIFGKAATSLASNFQYGVTYRPGGKAACSANNETIQFRLSEK